MLTKVYTVYDKKVSKYGNLITSTHVGEVTRSVERALGDPESALARWPGDFSIVVIGEYDQADGKLTATPVEVVLEVAALVRPKVVTQQKGGAQ